MGKYVRVLQGAVFDVAVDLRQGSPSFGKWVGRTLAAANAMGLWIPVGFAHGFVALEDATIVLYKCTNTYHPPSERSVVYNDPALDIQWPITPTLVSPKDAQAPRLADAEHNFTLSL
jgi:dTDP-4-dehydrorhamnose 3,5-epimerase